MARDAGLRRISAVTRWLTVAVVGLSGALALVASHAFHGHALSNSSAPTSVSVNPASPASAGLSPAAAAPAPTAVQPVVVSGGS